MSRVINDISAVRVMLGPGVLNFANAPLYYPRRRTTPPGVQQRHGAGRMGDEDRNAIRDRDRQSGPTIDRDVSVR